MGTLDRYQSPSATQLLTRILDRPELVAAVTELPAPVLATLIERVGLEDAGEIVAIATTAQLERVLDGDVWRADVPGADEHFAPERFALWLSVMLEAGEDAVARRLCELPRDLLTLAIHRFVRVMDRAAGADDADDDRAPCEAWEEFTLVARDRDAWDVVWTCLIALDREHHDLLRSLLERCCSLDADIAEDDGLHDVLTSHEMLESDVAAERDDRRSAGGYVSAADARSFLELARRGGPTQERDPITCAYFRALQDAGAEPPAPAATPHAASHRSAPQQLAAPRSDLPALVDLLRAAEVVEPPAVARAGTLALPAPDTHDTATTPGTTLLDAAMSELGTSHPLAFAARVEELGYLANVLIAAGSHAGRALRPVEALEAAIAACSLGMEDALVAQVSVASATAIVEVTSADRLFRSGYRTLHIEVMLPARARLDELGLDSTSSTELLALTETCPWLAGDLARSGRPFIASRDDVRAAREFIWQASKN